MEERAELLRRLRNGTCPVMSIVSAVRLLERFYKSNFRPIINLYDDVPRPDSRLRLVKSFVQFYERKYREPVVNATAEARNEAFRDYCGRIILYRYRLFKSRQRYYCRTYSVYKQAAKAIFVSFMTSPVSKNDYIFVVKTRRIQHILRAIIYRNTFERLQSAIKTLSDPNETDALQLLKLLSIFDYNLISSFQTAFSLRFRLGSESSIEWPPRIYWKVFLSTNIADVAVTAPRNYAIEQQTGESNKKLWYIRITNAQWRPINGESDLVSEKSRFVPRPCATKKQVEEAKSRRKLQWQEEMRNEFLLEQIGAAFSPEPDERCLTNWGNSLDYIEYAEDWLQLCANKAAPRGIDPDMQNQLDELRREMEVPNAAEEEYSRRINTRSSFASNAESEEEDGGFRADLSDEAYAEAPLELGGES